MTRKSQRSVLIGALFAVACVAVAIILSALKNNIVFFFSPSEVRAAAFPEGKNFRLGGLVEMQSLKRDGEKIFFVVTDGNGKIDVIYKGTLPDLFREGQGVVAEGHLQGNDFLADNVLAKHDENYMPREVADSLKKQGLWRSTVPSGALQR